MIVYVSVNNIGFNIYDTALDRTVLLLTFPSSHLLEIFRDVEVSENNIAECHLFCNKHLNDIITYINEYFAITITNT